MMTLLIATRNAHKATEVSAILGGNFQFVTLKDLPAMPEVVEDADTFAGNAAKKATALAQWLASDAIKPRLSAVDFVLADDSGLEVDALDGKPGIHSARFAALDADKTGNSKDTDNNAKLLRLLKDVPAKKRTARFRCVIALVEISSRGIVPTNRAVNLCLFEGTCEGRIDPAPRGIGGFGYDPLFVPHGYKESFAELGEDVKNRLSHRAKALAKLKDYFRNSPSA